MGNQQNASILRGFVEELPEDTLGLVGRWSWRPNSSLGDVKVSLLSASPTTEYSSNEGNE